MHDTNLSWLGSRSIWTDPSQTNLVQLIFLDLFHDPPVVQFWVEFDTHDFSLISEVYFIFKDHKKSEKSIQGLTHMP